MDELKIDAHTKAAIIDRAAELTPKILKACTRGGGLSAAAITFTGIRGLIAAARQAGYSRQEFEFTVKQLVDMATADIGELFPGETVAVTVAS